MGKFVHTSTLVIHPSPFVRLDKDIWIGVLNDIYLTLDSKLTQLRIQESKQY